MTGLVDLILNEDPPPLRLKGLTPQLKDIVLFLSFPHLFSFFFKHLVTYFSF